MFERSSPHTSLLFPITKVTKKLVAVFVFKTFSISRKFSFFASITILVYSHCVYIKALKTGEKELFLLPSLLFWHLRGNSLERRAFYSFWHHSLLFVQDMAYAHILFLRTFGYCCGSTMLTLHWYNSHWFQHISCASVFKVKETFIVQQAAHAARVANKKVWKLLIDGTYRWLNRADFKNVHSSYHIQQHIQNSAF